MISYLSPADPVVELGPVIFHLLHEVQEPVALGGGHGLLLHVGVGVAVCRLRERDV